jgi:hypothetical protein
MSEGLKSPIYNLLLPKLDLLTYKLSGQKGGHNLTAVFDKNLNPMDVINRLQELHGEPIQVISFKEPEKAEQAHEPEPTAATFDDLIATPEPVIEQPIIEQNSVCVVKFKLKDGTGGQVLSHGGYEQTWQNLVDRYGERLAA